MEGRVTAITKPRIRCAIYTRKSSEEGLEQSFNSLHAQREACEAYIASQRHEGWHALSTKYDDGGFSGGNIERPGLKQLLEDISAGKVNTVVVYKVDRLTRSLADFAKIIEQFDSQQVSFVSVTQQFNTTTSMGRLTLNVLLSFAQFEREVTGERIRDKIAASKRKGMWMGGIVPLGYDLKDRKLLVNKREAVSVREIFEEYLRLGCVSKLKDYLDQSSIRSKCRISREGRKSGGQKFSRGALYELLRNHIYVGEISHKGQRHPGEHAAVVERELFEKVQHKLTENRQGDLRRKTRNSAALLTGKLYDENGVRYIPTHSNKAGRRYHYYTSQAVIRNKAARVEIPRIPAAELDRLVTYTLDTVFSSEEELLKAAAITGHDSEVIAPLMCNAQRIADEWKTMQSNGSERVRRVLDQAAVSNGSLEIRLNPFELLSGCVSKGMGPLLKSQGGVIVIRLPLNVAKRGPETKLVLQTDSRTRNPSSSALINAVVRARDWYEMVINGEASSFTELARQSGVTTRYVTALFPCTNTSPSIVLNVLESKMPSIMTLKKFLIRPSLIWEYQRIEN
jgi:site-specific DNA recombinase